MKENFVVTYANVINNINQGTLTDFTTGNANTLEGTILNEKADAFSTAYTTLDNVGNNYNAVQFYNKQSEKLNSVLGSVASEQLKNASIANQNLALNTRNAEIKEWYFNNKLDTLFVFQLIFISLCFLAVIAYLMKIGIFGVGVFGMLVGLLVIVMILTIANRAIYTEKVRDKRYWTKRGFSSVGDALPGVNKKCN